MKEKIVAGVLIAVVLSCAACGRSVDEVTAISEEEAQEGGEQESREDLQEADGTEEGEPSENAGGEENDDDEEKVPETEEWEPDFSQLVMPTHKENYAEAICEVITALPAEKPESSLKQKDVDCDTLQWFNATYAMFTQSCNWDYHLVGGISDKNKNRVDYIKEQLDSSWGITDRQTMKESLCWLAMEGHSPDFAYQVQLLDMVGLLEGSDEEIKEAFAQVAEMQEYSEEDAAFIQEYYLQVRDIYGICGGNGIDAWDYCRIMQLCGGCYYAGYMTLEESLAVQLEVAHAIQDQFDSWQELNDSYYYGYSYWQNSDLAVSVRKMAYDTLMEMEDSPFKVLDFNMPLEKFW